MSLARAVAAAAGSAAGAPSPTILRAELRRLYATSLRGAGVVGPALAAAVAPLACGTPARGASAAARSPLAAAVGRRNFSLAMRMANSFLTPPRRSVDAETLKRLEGGANREPGNVSAQQRYLQALHE